MANVSWPTELPQSPQKDFTETIGVNIIRSAMDAGPAKQRRRSLRPTTMTLSFIMTTQQTIKLEDFVNNTLLGVKRFNFTHPRLGTTVECRLVPQGDGQFFTLQYRAPDYWQTNLQFEILP
jgi:hypothetical protein